MEVEDDMRTASPSVQARITDSRLWLLETLVAVMKLTTGQSCPKDGRVEEVRVCEAMPFVRTKVRRYPVYVHGNC